MRHAYGERPWGERGGWGEPGEGRETETAEEGWGEREHESVMGIETGEGGEGGEGYSSEGSGGSGRGGERGTSPVRKGEERKTSTRRGEKGGGRVYDGVAATVYSAVRKYRGNGEGDKGKRLSSADEKAMVRKLASRWCRNRFREMNGNVIIGKHRLSESLLSKTQRCRLFQAVKVYLRRRNEENK